ncbi:MAG: ArsA-related P-loop ATPase [Pseudomonadota bacterium]
MSAVHFILQGKGGVGKSLVSSVIAQYYNSKSRDVLCIDTDPLNQTFFQYKKLNVEFINLIENDDEINSRLFDGLVEKVAKHNDIAIIDNGASSFIPLSFYMKESHLIEFLEGIGKEVYIHTIITGGQSLKDTCLGLAALLDSLKAKIIIWENEFFGDIQNNGKLLSDFNIIKDNQDRIKGIIRIEQLTRDTFAKDFEYIIAHKMTFEEAIEFEEFGLMPRHRLKMIRDNLFNQMNAIGL